MKRDIFQALSDPTRRAILMLLATQAMTPNALAEQFHTTRQAVSKHIKILSESNLVTQDRQGREIHYNINPESINEIEHWIEQFKGLLQKRFSQLDEVLNNLNLKK